MILLPLLLVVLEELRRGREPELLHARELRRRRFLRVHAGRLRLEFVVHGVDDVQTAHGLRRRSAFFAFARASPRGVLAAVFKVSDLLELHVGPEEGLRFPATPFPAEE